MEHTNIDYSQFLNKNNDFTKFNKDDINNALKCDVDILKNESIEFHNLTNKYNALLSDATLKKTSKMDALQKYYNEQLNIINSEYEENVKNIKLPSNDDYINRKKIFVYVSEFNSYKKETEECLKSFDICLSALKKNNLNDSFIKQIQTDKIDVFMDKSNFMKGLKHYCITEQIPIDLDFKLDNDIILNKTKLLYSIPYNMRPYENIAQFENPSNDYKSNDYKSNDYKYNDNKSNDYQTSYYDVNTTYEGSILETGTNIKLSSTDYWLFQRELKINN